MSVPQISLKCKYIDTSIMIHIFPQQLLPEFEIAGVAQACPYKP